MAQISRRDFLKGAVATGMLGAVAATGLGCAPAQQTSREALSETGTVADAAETSSWRVAPESVAEDAIVDETVADIVVIGAGHAGTATARSAAEKSGKSVVLLEALEVLDPESDTYALDVISLVEATLDDPRQILRAQQRQARDKALF